MLKESADEGSGGFTASVLGCNVNFETGLIVNGQLLALIDGASQTRIVLSRVLIVGVILGSSVHMAVNFWNFSKARGN
jgi:hypothetical protein